MGKRVALALISFSGLLAGLMLVLQLAGPSAEAALAHRRFLLGIAADSAPVPATATPTSTPVPGSGPQGGLLVTVIIRIRALELAATATGTKPVMINAEASVPMPTAQQVVNVAAGTFSITEVGVDDAGCAWDRTDESTTFSVAVYHTSDLSVVLGIVSPEWHYTILCPGGAPPIRSPAFGEESLELFLRDLMEPYRSPNVNTVQLPLSAPATPGCLKGYGAFSDSGIQADPAQVFVYLHETGCALPPLPPLPTQSPTPTTGP